MDAAFERIAATTGSGSTAARSRLLSEPLARATRDEQDFLVRLIYGELRQGALAVLMAEALAAAARGAGGRGAPGAHAGGRAARRGARRLTEGRPGLARFRLQLFRAAPADARASRPATSPRRSTARRGRPRAEARRRPRPGPQGGRRGPRLLPPRQRCHCGRARAGRDRPGPPRAPAPLDGEAIALRPDGPPQPFQVTMRRFGRKLDVDRLRGRASR